MTISEFDERSSTVFVANLPLTVIVGIPLTGMSDSRVPFTYIPIDVRLNVAAM